MDDHRRDIPGLLPDDLGAGVLQDCGAVNPWLKLRAHKVLHCLADAPHAGVPFTGGAVKLDNLRGQRRRIQQEPALVEHGNAGTTRFASGARGHGIGDQHAHRRLQTGIGAESLDVEEQPITLQAHRSGLVEQPGVNAAFRPGTQFHRRQVCLIDRALHLLGVPPVGKLFPQIVKGRNRVGVSDGAALINAANRIGQHTIQQRRVGFAAIAEHVAGQVLQKSCSLVAGRRLTLGQVPGIQRFPAIQVDIDDAAAH